MFKVKYKNKIYTARDGETLFEVLAGEPSIPHICSGRGVCKKCRVTVNGESVLSCQYTVHSDITVEHEDEGPISSKLGLKTETGFQDALSLALDIGTTTLALAVVDTKNKKTVKTAVCDNPGRSVGGDVISRISYARLHGVSPLCTSLRSAVLRLIKSTGFDSFDTLLISGNTVMLHIFWNEDCVPLGTAPYTPAFLEEKTARGSDIGFDCVKTVRSLPMISAFAGADIVAGLYGLPIPAPDKYNILIDLGTNAEIVLFSENKTVCTSAAAGPCFEGEGIKCGMSATDGAICSFSLLDGKPLYKTVGNKPAKGICGTGLIDICASLLENEYIDRTGFMENDFEICGGVKVTPEDIRRFQTAKSAVCSVVLCLIREENIPFESIESLYISGGFSALLNPASVARVGFLPKELSAKLKAVYNTSLFGTVKALLSHGKISFADTKYRDLSENPLFAELFIKNMLF